jgi:hypothetical protein
MLGNGTRRRSLHPAEDHDQTRSHPELAADGAHDADVSGGEDRDASASAPGVFFVALADPGAYPGAGLGLGGKPSSAGRSKVKVGCHDSITGLSIPPDHGCRAGDGVQAHPSSARLLTCCQRPDISSRWSRMTHDSTMAN